MSVLHGQPASSPFVNMAFMLFSKLFKSKKICRFIKFIYLHPISLLAFYPALLKMAPATIYKDIEFFAGVGKNMVNEKKSKPELVIFVFLS
jgi:hypothetical protein